MAKQAGATVLSTASSDEKLERLREFGLDHGINYATESFVERTQELTDSGGVNVVLDPIGGQNLVDSIGALAYRGTLVSVGVAGRGGSGLEARDLWAQNNTLRGVFLGGALLSFTPRRDVAEQDQLPQLTGPDRPGQRLAADLEVAGPVAGPETDLRLAATLAGGAVGVGGVERGRRGGQRQDV